MANLQNNPTKEKKSTENIVVLPRRQSEDKVKTKRLLQSLPTFCPTAAKQKKQLLFPSHPVTLVSLSARADRPPQAGSSGLAQ
nr:hypothetical protein [uncultured Capnocytophaga sp.]